LDRDRFPADDPAREGLPRLSGITRWKKDDIPTASVQIIANVTGVEVEYWRAAVSLEEFETYVKEHRSPEPAPAKAPPLAAGMVAELRTALANNEHVGDVLIVLCNAVVALSIDDIAGRVGVSIIQVREIARTLSAIGAVDVTANIKPKTGAPNNVALSQIAQLHRDEIQALANAS